MNRTDRLLGLARLVTITAGRRLLCAGVPGHVLDALVRSGVDVRSAAEGAAHASASRAPVDGALLVAGTPGEAGELLQSLDKAPGVVAWLLWPTGRSADVRAAVARSNLQVIGRFGVADDASSPTHLVRTDLTGARRWYAASARPAWGPRSRVARRVGSLPLVAPWGFGHQALLLAGPLARPQWPLAPESGPTVPTVVSLGGGPSAGRSVLCYGDARGRPLRHVKVDGDDREASIAAEESALRLVASLDGLRGTAPESLGSVQGPGWSAFGQTHLAGTPMDRRWERGGPRRWESDLTAVFSWLQRLAVATAEVNTLPAGDLGAARLAMAGSLPERLAEPVSRGMRLGARSPRLVHGDLWPANVLRDRHGPAVLDWEAAGVGHPLLDAIHFAVTAHQTLSPGMTVAEAGVHALTGSRPALARARGILRRLGQSGLTPAELDDLALAQLVEIAGRPGPGGGAPDEARRRAWLECAVAVADHRSTP